jgi:uncharacterized protein involved in cysteine biosynthesis
MIQGVFTYLPLLNLVIIPVTLAAIRYALRIERRLMRIELRLKIVDPDR